MAREILFKAKRIDNGEWVEGNILLSDDTDDDFEAIIIPKTDSNMFTKHSGLKEISCDLGFEKWYKVDKNTICQYTGLTDKNGNKIWENDICECVFDGSVANRVIVWDESELDFKGTNGKENYGTEYNYLGCLEEIVVIGNIFDNPELLKGGE